MGLKQEYLQGHHCLWVSLKPLHPAAAMPGCASWRACEKCLGWQRLLLAMQLQPAGQAGQVQGLPSLPQGTLSASGQACTIL